MLKTRNLTKSFHTGSGTTQILKGIDLEVREGEFLAIMGRSGAGKSTLMYQLSLLDEPTGGEITINGIDTHAMSDHEKVAFRLKKLGYVFQDYALLPDLTALENVMLPLMMEDIPREECERLSREALVMVNLGDRLGNLPSQLSGGEQQRVSVARAIAHRPDILFADEPTANLDRESSKLVMEIFCSLHAQGQTIIMVTHEPEYGEMAERILVIDEGRIVETREAKR